ncbi:Nucleic acid-binding, OB-fold protein [Trifolium repens]|nr:Nucleic acid-binding, OB-fold protein [Trifolium repens]
MLPTSHSTTTFTNSYSIRDKLLSSLTVKAAGSVTSIRPHLSTASLIDPLNMSILALRRMIVEPSFTKSTEKKQN